METVNTFKKLQVHLLLPEIKDFTLFGLTSLLEESSMENKSFHKQYLYRVIELILFM